MNVHQPTRENLKLVAEEIRSGHLAILPTETVYGLAADATNPEAVARIFELKGRPADNPLIVHVSSIEQFAEFAAEIPETVHLLAAAFMPGPLTVVLPKRSSLSNIVTGGLDTVAIRIPDHPACLAVMELGELALAMPSANRFISLSPTNVNMLQPSIAAGVSTIIDGGPCTIGIESTILDLTGEPTILRPGIISQSDIEKALQSTVHHGDVSKNQPGMRVPGMYRRHYAPRTHCTVAIAIGSSDAGLVFESPANENQIQMPADPKGYARLLYASFADLDSRGLEEFFIVPPPQTELWAAVWDRLSKATY